MKHARFAGTVMLVSAALAVAVAVPPTTPARAASSLAGCTRVVSTSGELVAAVDTSPAGAAVCIRSGSYTVGAPMRPSSRVTVRGVDPAQRPVITCKAQFCLDGYNWSVGVRVQDLILQGAWQDDLRTGDAWYVQDVTARNAGIAGFRFKGSNAVITDSGAYWNGEFGVYGVDAVNSQLIHSTVGRNPTNPTFGPGYSGGVKFVTSRGVLLQGNVIRNNWGGAGLWLDIDTNHFTITGNTLTNNANDAMRIEISCYGVIQDNSVVGSGGSQIDLFNAHDVQVVTNSVLIPWNGSYGIRMLGNGRRASLSDQCGVNGQFPNSNNTARSNHIISHNPVATNGVFHTAGSTTNDTWVGNVYVVPACSGPQWRWWSGSNLKVNFRNWRLQYGQDQSGSCSTL